MVQNRVALAQPILPDVVQRKGISVKRKPRGVLLLVTISAPGGRYDTTYLSNYTVINITDELLRVAGVGAVLPIGVRDYAMRIWLDPDKLASRKLTAGDVVEAINQQNLQVAGKLGQPPAGKEQAFTFTLETLGRLAAPEEVGDIILKTDGSGRKVRLRDVGRVELGADSRSVNVRLNGKPCVVLAVYPTWKTKPQLLSAAVRDRIAQLQKRAPDGVRLDVTFDFTPNLENPDRPATSEYLLLDPTLPADSSDEKTEKLMARCSTLLRTIAGVHDVLILSDNPFDYIRSRPCALIRLVPSSKRQSTREQMMQILRTRLTKDFPELSPRLRDVSALGRFPYGGYPINLGVQGTESDRVRELAEKLADRLRGSKKLTDVAVNPETAPGSWISFQFNRDECARLGVAFTDIKSTLAVNLGLEVSDFNRFGLAWEITLLKAGKGNETIESLKQLKIRNSKGKMVPLSQLAKVRTIQAPAVIERLNAHQMEQITANPAPEVTLAQIHTLCETLAGEVRRELGLPVEYRLTWLRELPEAK